MGHFQSGAQVESSYASKNWIEVMYKATQPALENEREDLKR